MNVFDIFSLHSKKALKNAYLLALKNNCEYIEPSHILLGILQEKGSIASEILHRVHLKEKQMHAIISKENGTGKIEPAFSDKSRKAIERAAVISSLNEHQYVGTEHLLFGILELNDKKVEHIFRKHHISPPDLKSKVKLVFKSTSHFPQISNTLSRFPGQREEIELDHFLNVPNKKTLLEFFAAHLTDKKIQKNIDPVIGRSGEIDRIIQILARRTKNNPLLLGEPGVGKTAIVEGLAKLILEGKVPDVLLNKRIYSLDLGLLVAGSSFRGEFEQRLKQIILEIKSDENIILFIDEIHNVIGAGSASGSLDAANILKPSLARGEIRCIGATTMEEYKKHLENDSAFERRFQAVIIEEPSAEKTFEILAGVKQHYEKFHRVLLSDSALWAAVKLSQRYLPDKFFPDKAIDLLDEAASSIRVKSKPDENEERLRALKNLYENILEEKKHAIILENYDLALNLKQKEEAVIGEMAKIKKLSSGKKIKYTGEVTEGGVREVVSRILKIPLQEIDSDEKKNFLALETRLAQYIAGQDSAIKTVCEFIRKSRTGISDPQRPLGSFIFLGPSGVGKTELAKTLAQVVFNDQKALIRIDMSEYAESFNISKLIGSPAGYVGYKDQNALTDRVRQKPYSVLLFDEIEKAHPLIFNLLLQILEDGRLTDASGKSANFKNTLIIMTSNIGSETFLKQATFGFDSSMNDEKKEAAQKFEDAKKIVLEQLSKFFKTEFLNRVDKVVVFSPLNFAAVKKIVDIELKKLQKKLDEKNIRISYNEDVIEYLSKKSHSPRDGARAVRKIVSELVENPLAEKILAAEEPYSDARIQLEKNSIQIINVKNG